MTTLKARLHHVGRGLFARHAPSFSGFGLGIGTRVLQLLSPQSAAERELAHLDAECRTAFDAKDYDTFVARVEQLAHRFPNATENFDRYLRLAMGHPFKAACEDAAEISAAALGKDHPWVKKWMNVGGHNPPPPLDIILSTRAGLPSAVATLPPNDSNRRPVASNGPTKPKSSSGDRRGFHNVVELQGAAGSPRTSRSRLASKAVWPSPDHAADETRAISQITKNTERPVESFCTLIGGPDALSLVECLTPTDRGELETASVSQIVMQVRNATNHQSLEAALRGPKTGDSNIEKAANALFKNAAAIEDIIIQSAAPEQVAVFHTVVKFVSLVFANDPLKAIPKLTSVASRLPAYPRLYILEFVKALVSINGIEDKSLVFPSSMVTDFVSSVSDWEPGDLRILDDLCGDHDLPPETCISAFGSSEKLQQLSRRVPKDQPNRFLSSFLARAARDKRLADKVRIVAIEYCLRHGTPIDLPAAFESLNYLPECDFVVDAVSDSIAANIDVAPDVLRQINFFSDVVVQSPATAPRILQLFLRNGGYLPFIKLLKKIKDKDASWGDDLDWALPRKFDGSALALSALQRENSVTVLTDLPMPASSLPGFKISQNTMVYTTSASASDISSDGVKVVPGGQLNEDQDFIRSLTRLSETVAFSLTKRFQSQVQSSDVLEVMQDIEPALFMSVKSSLLSSFRRSEIQSNWRRFAEPGSVLLLLFESTNTLEDVLESLDETDVKSVVICSAVSKKSSTAATKRKLHSFKKALSADRKERKEALRGGRSDAEDTRSVLSANDTRSAPLDRFLRDTIRNSLAIPGSENPSATLFVTRLGAKTVPGTILPVVQRLMKQQDVSLLNIETNKDVKPESFFASIEPNGGTHFSVLSTKDVRQFSNRSVGSTKKAADPYADWFNEEWSRAGSLLLGPENQRYYDVVRRSGANINQRTLAYLTTLQKTLNRLIDPQACQAVYMSPGRSIEAYAAQTIAARKEVLTIDITNAWMSERYTYAKPRGDLVTALDRWTSNLLSNYFGIPADCIRLTGTPRYDGLYERSQALDPRELKVNLGFNPSQPLVCIALQPLVLATNRQIIAAVMEGTKHHPNMQVLVKPHPRESEVRLSAYQQEITKVHSSDTCTAKVLPKANIIEALVASDTCVTTFSNVGVEAALCQRNTLLCRFEGMETPIALDEMGLGYAVGSPEELTATLSELLSDGAVKAVIEQRRDKFFEDNPHYLNSSATETIADLQHEHEFIGRGRERSLITELK